MNIYAIAVQKGGTGKTTTAAAIAQAAAHRENTRKKMRVLAIDLDPQGNLSFALAADTNRPGSYELLEGTPTGDLIQHSPQGMDVIPASWSLSTIKSAPGSARRLQNALQEIRDKYDIIVIDTPPTAGELQYNALQAATRLIIPLETDAYNLQSLQQIAAAARQFQKSNPELLPAGVILTKYDGRAIINRQLRDALENAASRAGIPFLGTVRKSVVVQEAAALQVSLFDYAPRSKPTADYRQIYKTLMKQEKRRKQEG